MMSFHEMLLQYGESLDEVFGGAWQHYDYYYYLINMVYFIRSTVQFELETRL